VTVTRWRGRRNTRASASLSTVDRARAARASFSEPSVQPPHQALVKSAAASVAAGGDCLLADPVDQGGGFALVVVVGLASLIVVAIASFDDLGAALRSRAHKPARRAASSRSPWWRIPRGHRDIARTANTGSLRPGPRRRHPDQPARLRRRLGKSRISNVTINFVCATSSILLIS
jgi:hypothetical protein